MRHLMKEVSWKKSPIVGSYIEYSKQLSCYQNCVTFLFPFPQVASCTLDASAKIYAGRVDSIHAQAYKMLGGLGRAENQGSITWKYILL